MKNQNKLQLQNVNFVMNFKDNIRPVLLASSLYAKLAFMPTMLLLLLCNLAHIMNTFINKKC